MDHNCGDPLRPKPLLSFHIRTRSESTSRALLCSAESVTRLPYSCSNIKALLYRTPSIPQSPEIFEVREERSLYIEGYATWAIPAGNKPSSHVCELGPVKDTSRDSSASEDFDLELC